MMSYYSCLVVLLAITSAHSWTPADNSKQEFSCPENEEYYKCSQIHCYKRCEHLTKPPACPSVSADCYNPSCECVQDYLRNSDGICVPFQKCDNWKPPGADPGQY